MSTRMLGDSVRIIYGDSISSELKKRNGTGSLAFSSLLTNPTKFRTVLLIMMLVKFKKFHLIYFSHSSHLHSISKLSPSFPFYPIQSTRRDANWIHSRKKTPSFPQLHAGERESKEEKFSLWYAFQPYHIFCFSCCFRQMIGCMPTPFLIFHQKFSSLRCCCIPH